MTRRIFRTDLALPEGPSLLEDGSWLVAEMALARGCVTQIDATGASVRTLARTGRPNGIAIRGNEILVAESLTPSLLGLQRDGTARTIATSCEGHPLLWPNDLCVGPNGAIYVTDSGALVVDFLEGDAPSGDFANVAFDGRICRFGPAEGEERVLDEGLRFANGIAFGPDGLLYATETFTGNVYRYDTGQARPDRELFANVLDPSLNFAGLRGPDGMAFDNQGRLYVAVFGQGDVTILNPDGQVGERIPTGGRNPTNVAFGPPDSGDIYVTEDDTGCLEVYHVGADGLPLHDD